MMVEKEVREILCYHQIVTVVSVMAQVVFESAKKDEKKISNQLIVENNHHLSQWSLFILKEPHALSLRKKPSMRLHSYWESAGLMVVTVKVDKVLPISDSLKNREFLPPILNIWVFRYRTGPSVGELKKRLLNNWRENSALFW